MTETPAASAPTPYPAPASAWWSAFVLSLLGFLASVDLSLTALLIEPMKGELALSDVQIGLLQGTAFGLAFGLSSIPLGRLIDRGVRRRLLAAALVVWAAAMAGTALAHGIAVLVACRIALGAVVALLIPASISLLSDLFPPERRSVATSLFAVGQACGQGFGIFVGGVAFDALTRLHLAHPRSAGGLTAWRLIYLGAGLLALVLLPLVVRMREPARQEVSADSRSAMAALRELWAWRGFLGPLLGALLFSSIAIQGAYVWTTPLLIRVHHLTPGEFAGWLSAVSLGGGILGAVAGGQLGEFGRKRGGPAGVLPPALIAALAIAPTALFALAPSVPVFAGLLGLNLFFGALVATIGVIAITLNIPNEIRGMAIGANVLITALFGAATAPAAIALLSRMLGGEAMLGPAVAGVGVPSAVIGAALFGVAMRASARRQGAPSPTPLAS